jgi:hypothetical protein
MIVTLVVVGFVFHYIGRGAGFQVQRHQALDPLAVNEGAYFFPTAPPGSNLPYPGAF